MSYILEFTEFDPLNLVPGGALQDTTGSFSDKGFTINNGLSEGTKVDMFNFTTEHVGEFAMDPYSSGYIWNVNWGSDSTHETTPIAVYFAGGGITFYILDPNDENHLTGISSGTFNFPATFTPTNIVTNYRF